jgi:hypothetical protein
MLFALGAYANRKEQLLTPKDQAVQMDDEQLQLVEAPGRQVLQFLAALFNKLAADAGPAEL